MPRSQQRPGTPTRRLLTRGRLLLLVLVGLVCGLVFLPVIVANTALSQVVIDLALVKFKGRVSVGGVSLGWLSPIRLTDIVAIDERGNQIARIEQLHTTKPLLALLASNDWGRVELVKPHVHLHTWDESSNLEEAIEEFLVAAPSGQAVVPATIAIVGGSMLMTTDGDTRQRRADDVNGAIIIGGPSAAVQLSLNGRLSNSAGFAGNAQIGVELDPGYRQVRLRDLSVQVRGDRAPLGAVTPVVRRFLGAADITGIADGQLDANWSRDTGSWGFGSKKFVLVDASVRVPRVFGPQRWASRHAAVSGEVQLTGNSLLARQLVCDLDFARVRANGQMNWDQFARALSGGEIPDTDFAAEGRVDLARLSRAIPDLLPIQQDVVIQSGEIKFDTSSSRQPNGRRAIVNVEASQLVADRGGQRFTWHRPVRLAATILQSDGETILEKAVCESSVLTIQGHAKRDRGHFTVQGDLDKLAARLRQFFDLGQAIAHGRLEGEIGWNVVPGPTVATPGVQPMLVSGRFAVWPYERGDRRGELRPELEISVGAQGYVEPDRTVRLNQGELSMVAAGAPAGQDSLGARLTHPVVNPGLAATWHLEVEAAGSLANWLRRVRPVFSPDIGAEGDLNFSGKLSMSPQFIAVTDADYRIKDLEFDGYGLKIREPRIEGRGQIRYRTGERTVEVVDATFASSALSARGQDVSVNFADARATGTIAYRADLGRLSRWFQPGEDGGTRIFGQAQGSLQLESVAATMRGRINTTVNDLVVARLNAPNPLGRGPAFPASNQNNWSVRFRDQRVELTALMQMEPAQRRIQFEKLELQASAASASVSGFVDDFGGTYQANLSGRWLPNWAQVNNWIQARAGDRVSVQGGEAQPLEIRGPLISAGGNAGSGPLIDRQLSVNTSVVWRGGQLMGIPFGPSRMAVNLKNSVASITTSDFAFAGGTIRLNPRVNMAGNRPVLMVGRGAILEKIDLTPEMCGVLLKYTSPLLANVTQAQGRFSLATDGVRIPLDGSWNGDVRATLVIHRASIGPGPLGQQILVLTDQLKALAEGRLLETPQRNSEWLTMPEQSIPIAYHDGRIYHEAMAFKIRDVSFSTRGAVGLDQSVNVIASVPVLDRWVEGKRFWQALQGQTIELPIIGSLSHPVVDSRAINRLGTQILGQSAGGLLQGELQNLIQRGGGKLENEIFKGLNQLFGPDR